ncbi:HtaA domain-containing protein [Arthrobacter sp. B2a2-09]|uniref:HtaA domain-containing protein n=1 Tax=Arthrobacter sp. B2a2-09 TaxID=2952822 RepID=UPI0022CDB6B8|nr:HtaA domain-containing protein [Arthrobacter sp. B2a2-09]MCZ9881963.1 HtaA domain-containing protein [Arthrobacter sp. B2a2-09]
MTALHDEVDRGSLTWAVRDSLLRYVTVIARGSFVVEDGTTVTDDGAFTFPLRNAVQVGNEWRLSFGGSVRFTAHHGFLDIRIAKPELVMGPEGGVLSARTDDGGVTTTLIAVTGAEELGREGTDLLWTATDVHLLETGVELFGGVYPAGTGLAPLKIRASLDS